MRVVSLPDLVPNCGSRLWFLPMDARWRMANYHAFTKKNAPASWHDCTGKAGANGVSFMASSRFTLLDPAGTQGLRLRENFADCHSARSW